MKIHPEGYRIVLKYLLLAAAINVIVYLLFTNKPAIYHSLVMVSALLLLFILRFFRYPLRELNLDENLIYSPADGKIVVLEEAVENEYFKEKRMQVSIFMSIWNVHVNWAPISGSIHYNHHSPGHFKAAWHPKSSELNERNTISIKPDNQPEILVRQIAGAVARRILSPLKKGDTIQQGNEIGMIRFGSRVDLYLPLDVKLNVKMNQKVRAKKTLIGSFS